MSNVDNRQAETTNPVMDTARMTLSSLADAGVKEAVEFARKLGLEDYVLNYGKSGYADRFPHAVMQEARFEYLNDQIRKTGNKNIIDLACGFSPRGLRFAREGYNYIGVDLQAAVTAMKPLAEAFTAEEDLPGSFTYCMADVTDADSLAAVADRLDGAITIVCEGLFMYLTYYEVASMIEGLKRILSAHGGCFFTPDFSSVQMYKTVLFGILTREQMAQAFEKSRSTITKKSDTDMRQTLVGRETDDNAFDFFTEHGAVIERVPYLADGVSLATADKLPAEKASALKAAMNKVPAWKVTFAAEKPVEVDAKNLPFAAGYVLADGALNVTLQGRVDSITAPEFLTMFEQAKAEGEIRSVRVDMGGLAYISSAGLRVLMLMKKHIGGGALEAVGVNATVMEILEQTGFDNIVDVL